ncbi:MAG: nuclear transport factor 2 family protein [Halioglobus sp.]|nr:nuclear transport factor 2 family protein [Halioglobus sp.]
MSLAYLESKREHPARTAAMKSIAAVQGKDREAWLAMWHDDGLLQDPVGISPLDPEGKGHRGIAAITEFYDNVIAQGDVRFHIRESFAAGDECANVGTITTRGADGSVARCELVMLYRVDAHGKVLSLRAFWEFDDMMAGYF